MDRFTVTTDTFKLIQVCGNLGFVLQLMTQRFLLTLTTSSPTLTRSTQAGGKALPPTAPMECSPPTTWSCWNEGAACRSQVDNVTKVFESSFGVGSRLVMSWSRKKQRGILFAWFGEVITDLLKWVDCDYFMRKDRRGFETKWENEQDGLRRGEWLAFLLPLKECLHGEEC